jgi:hypothetical protein
LKLLEKAKNSIDDAHLSDENHNESNYNDRKLRTSYDFKTKI